MQVWRHPTDDTIRVQYDEDSIAEFSVLCDRSHERDGWSQ